MTFRRGMTIAERRRLREEILQRHLERARQVAAGSRLTLRCQDAMRLTGSEPERARGAHEMCQGEQPPRGAGCLCLCHDTVTGSVEAGKMEQMPLPAVFEE